MRTHSETEPPLETALARLHAHQPLTQAQADESVRQWRQIRRRRQQRYALIALAWIAIILVATIAVMRHDPAWLLVAVNGLAFLLMVPVGYQLSMSAWDDDPMAVLGLYECTDQDLRRIRDVCDRSPQARTIVRQWMADGEALRTRELVELIAFDHALTAHEELTQQASASATPSLARG